jgi:hypothetical protein
MTVFRGFKPVCETCNSLGIVLEYGEGAPSSMQIKCSGCGAPRGTLGALRNLARSRSKELFELQNPVEVSPNQSPFFSAIPE